jgi:phenylacetic acid degradation operon negative regulatory protein
VSHVPHRSEAGPGARALLLTILGEFVLPSGDSAWTTTLIEGLALLGVEEATARQALARSSAAGLIVAERDGRRTRWTLTPRAHRLLTEGAARIYGHGRDHQEWDGRWLLVMRNVPERNRHLRARLRSRLTWYGLGSLGSGMWVTPWCGHEAEVATALEELGLVQGAMTWVARPGSLGDFESRVGDIWDLEGVAASYRAFISRVSGETAATSDEFFSSLVRLVHDWRHFPAADPGLPSRLLPGDWPAAQAAELFASRRKAWATGAWGWWRVAEGNH